MSENVYTKLSDDEAAILFPAIHIAMMITALADGPLGQNEKDALIEVFYAGHRWHMSPRVVLTKVQTLVNLIKLNEAAWPTLFEQAKGLSGNSKIEILRTCAKMAHMDDGAIGPEEQEAMDSISSMIKIEPQDLEAWQAEYQSVLCDKT